MLISSIEHNIPVGLKIDISETELAINLYTNDNNEYYEYEQVIFNINDLKSYSEWRDYSIWVMCCDLNKFKPRSLVNRSALTLSSRMNSSRFFNIFNIFTNLTMLVPHQNCSFLDCNFVVSCADKYPPICNIPIANISKEELMNLTFPILSIGGETSVLSNAVLEYELEIDNFEQLNNVDTFVNIEASAGYLPVRRLHVNSKKTKFKFHSTGLESGSNLQIRAGYRFWEAATTKDVSIA